jgi:hypothetical protein
MVSLVSKPMTDFGGWIMPCDDDACALFVVVG